MIKLNVNDARELAYNLLVAKGVKSDVASNVAEHLIASNQAGYASHGFTILPNYLKAIDQGTLKPDAKVECYKNEGALLGYEANLGFGQNAAKIAFEEAFKSARKNGICAMTIRHAHHIGRVGFYGEMACKEGMALIVFCNIIKRSPTVVPFGGTQAKLTTNPMCFAWPAANGKAPFVLDLATAAIALNKARNLANNGQQAPEGCLVDANGKPTTDPNVLFQNPHGNLLTFGGHKGYGLGLAVELFAGILSGGGTIRDGEYGNGMAVNNIFSIVIDVSKFNSSEWVEKETSDFLSYLKDCPPQEGMGEILYAGEIEERNRIKYAEIIDVDEKSWKDFSDLALQANVKLPEVH